MNGRKGCFSGLLAAAVILGTTGLARPIGRTRGVPENGPSVAMADVYCIPTTIESQTRRSHPVRQ